MKFAIQQVFFFSFFFQESSERPRTYRTRYYWDQIGSAGGYLKTGAGT